MLIIDYFSLKFDVKDTNKSIEINHPMNKEIRTYTIQ